MTAQRFDYLSTGCFPPEPFRFAGRRFDDPALLALCRVYGRDRVRNACIELDVLPYADTLKEILHWCHEDDNAAIY